MRKKALITGAAGFIGKPLVEQLLARDWSVTGYDVKPKPQAPVFAACDWVKGSILDENSLKHAMAGCDTVFHLAARAHLFAKDPALFDQINRLGTQVVRGIAESSDVQHLIVTLSAVGLTPIGYRGVIDGRTRPDTPDQLAGPYARSKWQADVLLDAPSAMAITRLYPTIPLGSGDDALTAPTLMVKRFLTDPPSAFLETALNFIPVRDVAQAHVLAAEKLDTSPENQARRYVVSGERWMLSAFLKTLGQLTGRPMPTRQIPYALARIAAGIMEPLVRMQGRESLATVEGVRVATADPEFDPTKTKRDLGWQASSVATALSETLNWLQV